MSRRKAEYVIFGIVVVAVIIISFFVVQNQTPLESVQPTITSPTNQTVDSNFKTSAQHVEDMRNPHLLTAAKEDVDGDGAIETISLTVPSGETEPVKAPLIVNAVILPDAMPGDFPEGFSIIDIDKTDQYKEIAIYSSMPSSDHHYVVYRFQNNTFSLLGEVGCLIKDALIGDGTIITTCWGGFWHYNVVYKLNTVTRQIEKVKQDEHDMNLVATTSQQISLLQDMNSSKVVATVKAGEKIYFLKAKFIDPNNLYLQRYLVRDRNGVTGWLPDVSLQDYFSDLIYAD